MKEELAGLLQIPSEQVDKTVHESKCDDLSAMFNMMLDVKRSEKGKDISHAEVQIRRGI